MPLRHAVSGQPDQVSACSLTHIAAPLTPMTESCPVNLSDSERLHNYGQSQCKDSPARVSQEPTQPTDVHLKGIAGDHQPLQQHHAGSVTDQTVPLHLTQAQASVTRSPLGRLPVGSREQNPLKPFPHPQSSLLLPSPASQKKQKLESTSHQIQEQLAPLPTIIRLLNDHRVQAQSPNLPH